MPTVRLPALLRRIILYNHAKKNQATFDKKSGTTPPPTKTPYSLAETWRRLGQGSVRATTELDSGSDNCLRKTSSPQAGTRLHSWGNQSWRDRTWSANSGSTNRWLPVTSRSQQVAHSERIYSQGARPIHWPHVRPWQRRHSSPPTAQWSFRQATSTSCNILRARLR